MTKPTRRAILGAIVIAPIAASAGHAQPTPAADPAEWTNLVRQFRNAHAAYLVASEESAKADDAKIEAHHALARPPEPESIPGGIKDGMTIAEIRAACEAPEAKAAWAAYERDLALWQAKRDALDAQIAPATAAYDEAYALYAAAFNALADHRVSSVAQLAEKIEIIAADYAGCDVPGEYFAEVLADARRLSGEA